MTGIFRVTDYVSHSQAHSRVQWVANPLSVHVHIVLASRVDQIRDSALHRIELQTSRSYNPTLSTTEPRGRWNYNSNHSKYSKELRVHSYSEAGRPRWLTNATGRKFKINSEIVHTKKIHVHLCDVLSIEVSTL